MLQWGLQTPGRTDLVGKSPATDTHNLPGKCVLWWRIKNTHNIPGKCVVWWWIKNTHIIPGISVLWWKIRNTLNIPGKCVLWWKIKNALNIPGKCVLWWRIKGNSYTINSEDMLLVYIGNDIVYVDGIVTQEEFRQHE